MKESSVVLELCYASGGQTHRIRGTDLQHEIVDHRPTSNLALLDTDGNAIVVFHPIALIWLRPRLVHGVNKTQKAPRVLTTAA